MEIKIKYRSILILFASFLSIITFSNSHEIDLEDMAIKHPIIPIFNSKMKTAAGYFTIVNKKNEPDELVMVKTNFAKAMIHKTKIDSNGTATMEHVNNVKIPANSSVVFERGSLHIMFSELKEPLEEYIDQKVLLVFKNLGNIEINFQVEKASYSENVNQNHDH